MKTCSRCQTALPLTEFYPRRNRNNYSATCKACAKKRVEEWRSTPTGRAKTNAANRRYAKTKKGQRARLAAQASETRRLQMEIYRQSPEGREAARRANQSVAGRARQHRYFQSEKGKEAMRRKQHLRRLWKEAEATLTIEEWGEIKDQFHHRCAYCRQGKPLTQDHVIPLSKGGSHTKENVVPACRSCNGRKGNRLVETFDLFG